MEKKKRKPYLVKGPPVTAEEIVRIFRLSPERVARLTALVESTPGLHDSSAKIIRDHKLKALGAGS